MDSFKHSHSLGQNFLTDKNLLEAIVKDAGITRNDTVIEIGAGMGALTEPLVKTGARVISFEIDSRLKPFLSPLSSKYPNLEIIFSDFLKYDLKEIDVTSFKAVANLPYYITTPVLFRLLDDDRLSSATVMVQEEVADRIVAKAGGKDYGILSVSIQLSGSPKIMRKVGRAMFSPQPNVDSTVVRVDIERKRADEKLLSLVRAAFSMRRKTLVNCLSKSGYEKTKIINSLSELGFDQSVRGEKLTPEDFKKLSTLL